jgi:hypothetical protein
MAGEYTPTAWVDDATDVTAAVMNNIEAGLQFAQAKCFAARLATATTLPANTVDAGAGTLTANATGALTVDGVAVATGDIILVKNEAAGLKNGVYVVTAAGTIGASWVLRRSRDANAAATLISGALVSVSEGTQNAKTLWRLASTGSLAPGASILNYEPIAGNPKEVTALPANPYDGQEVYFVADASKGVLWHLRYRAAEAGSFKWMFLGGPPMTAEVLGSNATSSTSFVSLTGGPSLTTPLAGDYFLNVSFQGDGSNIQVMSYALGAVAATDDYAALTGTGAVATGHRERRVDGLAKAAVIEAKYRSANAVSGNFLRRYMQLVPVRVG